MPQIAVEGRLRLLPMQWGGGSPRSGETALMQEQVDFAEASGLGRAGLSGADAAMPGAINPASLAFHAPALDDHLRAEFYG